MLQVFDYYIAMEMGIRTYCLYLEIVSHFPLRLFVTAGTPLVRHMMWFWGLDRWLKAWNKAL